jgi:hypothetical protein
MSNLTPNQLRQLADLLDASVSAINRYQVENFNNISGTNHIIINHRENEITLYSDRLRVEAIILSIENASDFIEGVRTAIQEIENTISTIETVGKVINIATAVVALGLNIAKSNVDGAKDSLNDIVDILNGEEE